MYFSEPLSKHDLLVLREIEREEERYATSGVDRYTRRWSVGRQRDSRSQISPGINYLLSVAYR